MWPQMKQLSVAGARHWRSWSSAPVAGQQVFLWKEDLGSASPCCHTALVGAEMSCPGVVYYTEILTVIHEKNWGEIKL